MKITPIIDAELLIEDSTHSFSQEASTLGFKCGEWHAVFKTDQKIGNGMAFELIDVREGGTHYYRQICGCIGVSVFND